MNPTDDNELLSAYLDGEVTADEQARVERRLAEDAGYRQLHDELRALRQHLESLPMARLPADFSQTVLDAAERQMVAPRRAVANMEPVAAGLGSPDGRRWVRPLIWSGMIVAAGLMVMIFSPADKESSTAKVARNDAPQPAAEATAASESLAAKPGPSFEAAANSSIHAADDISAAPAAPPVELGKQVERGKPLENRALKMDQRRSGESEAQASQDAPARLRLQNERESQAAKRDEGNRRQIAGAATGGNGVDRDPATGGERHRAPQPMKKEAQKLTEDARPAASVPRPAEADASKDSQPFGFRGAPAPLPAAGAAPAVPAPIVPSQIEPRAPEAGFAQPLAPSITTAPQGGALAGQAAQGPARSAFDMPKVAPRGRGEEDLKQIEGAQKEISRPLNFTVTLSDLGGEQEEFEKLLASAKPDKKPAGKPQIEEADAQLQKAAVVDALNEAGGKRENGKAASQPQQVYEVDLTYSSLVDLLAQLRSRPAQYRLEPVSEPLGQEVKRRADELVLERNQGQAKGRALDKNEGKLGDGKSKEATEQDRAEKSGTEKSGTEKSGTEKSGDLNDDAFESTAPQADKAASPPAPQLYRVRIVLRRATADSEPAAAGQAPAPAGAPAP